MSHTCPHIPPYFSCHFLLLRDNIVLSIHDVQLAGVRRVEYIQISVNLATHAVEEADGKKCRHEKSWNTDQNGNDNLDSTGITRAKLCGDQVEMQAHTKKCEENVEVGECLGETEIARVTLAIADRSNMEMREDVRNHHSWVGAGN